MDTPDRGELVQRLIDVLREEAGRVELKEALREAHPADIADALEDLAADRRREVLQSLGYDLRAEILDEIAEEQTGAFVEQAPVPDLVRIIEEMPPDEAADILEHLEGDKLEAILNRLDPSHAQDVRGLMAYDSETAGGLMTTEFFWTAPEVPVAKVLEGLRAHYENLETLHEIFVCSPDRRLQGVIAVEDLIGAPPEAEARAIMDKAPIAISPLADQEECAQYMTKYDLSILPVVDAKRRLIGIITVDDILEVMEAEASEDMYRLAGVGATDPLEEATTVRAWKRLPWLAVSIVGYAVLCLIMARYEVTLEKIVALSFFVPAIMALGGNVGIQAATITVRGLAMGEIRPGDFLWILRRELLVALIIAVVCSLALALVAWALFALGLQSAETFSVARFAFTVGAAMFVGILGAVVFGTSVPMLCAAVGIDPAVAAGPFITALVDIGTQTIYLALATLLLLT